MTARLGAGTAHSFHLSHPATARATLRAPVRQMFCLASPFLQPYRTMRATKVLFFAADPLSADGRKGRLLVDEEVRQIRRRIQSAKYRDALDLDVHWATRTKDLLFALNQTRPQVVHFSGHGGPNGLVLAGLDGTSGHPVGASGLARLFEVFRGEIQVVVLNACFSRPQAEAIAEHVGCAIGTGHKISDEAAITFGATFYQAIAFGHSVQVAYNQARAALELDHFDEIEFPDLVFRADVDPSELFLIAQDGLDETDEVGSSSHSLPLEPADAKHLTSVSGTRSVATRRVRASVAALLVSAVAVAGAILIPRVIPPLPAAAVECASRPTTRTFVAPLPVPAPASAAPGDEAGVAAVLADAKSLCQVGNHAAAFAGFKWAAEAGSAEAMGYLGVAYLRGLGTTRQPEEGIKWLREAAQARDAHGMNALGMAYKTGDGVGQSNRWARYWFRIAADDEGYAESMRNLGDFAREEGNDTLAIAWYMKAVKAGSAEAMVDVGLMYEAGRAKDGDIDDARRWYRKAARRELARGMFALGRLYQNGLGVRRDFEEARSWYRKAAERGSEDAMNNLALLYLNGWGVPQDTAEAMIWFRRAAAAGSALAERNLAALGPAARPVQARVDSGRNGNR
jgi:TPR repeat protein